MAAIGGSLVGALEAEWWSGPLLQVGHPDRALLRGEPWREAATGLVYATARCGDLPEQKQAPSSPPSRPPPPSGLRAMPRAQPLAPLLGVRASKSRLACALRMRLCRGRALCSHSR